MPEIRKTASNLLARAAEVRDALTEARDALTVPTRRICGARQLWLFVAELSGVVLVAFGISFWSVPAALIVGGLVLVAAVEMQLPNPKVADVPPPADLLRHQAENAATLINNERYGLPFVDADRLAQLSRHECEQLIIVARRIGASK